MVTNEQRADRAYRHALIYAQEVTDNTENEDMESALIGLITDLAHMAENYYLGGVEALRIAKEHFELELEEV